MERLASRDIAVRWQVGLLAVAMSVAGNSVVACPFCTAPSLTLSEQISQSDAVVLVEWVSATEPDVDKAGTTKYAIKQIAKGKAAAVGDTIELTRYRAGKPGMLFMLMGSQGTALEWGSPVELSRKAFEYVTKIPAPELPTSQRLKFYLAHFESADPFIANDAYAEFAAAPYSDIKPLADALPREKLSRWIVDPKTAVTRLGLYGLLLGLCGDDADAEVMKQKIVNVGGSDYRLGIDGVMSGFLLIKGADGLKLIEDTKLKPLYLTDKNGKPLLDEKGNKRPVPFSETYAAMQALRFMWTYGDKRIAPARLHQSMRILLERPELADLVIADLARWKDWDVQDRLMDMYAAEGFDIPSIKRAIVRFMYYCSKDIAAGDAEQTAQLPPHVVRAQSHLAELEKRDPKTVKDAKRFLLP